MLTYQSTGKGYYSVPSDRDDKPIAKNLGDHNSMKYFALLLDQMPSQVLPSQHIKSQLMTYYRIHSTFLYCWKENLHFCKEMSHVQTLLPKAESSPEAHFFPNPSSIVNFFYFWNELGFLFSSLMNK